MLGIELLLDTRERAILAVIRAENDNGFMEVQRILGLIVPLDNGGYLMPSIVSLVKKGFILFGEKHGKKFVYLISWHLMKKLIPEGFVVTIYPSCLQTLPTEASGAIGPHSVSRTFQPLSNSLLGSVENIHNFWRETFNTRRQMTAEDKSAISKLLKEHDEAEIKRAIIGLSLSEWHTGDNPQGIKYISLRHVYKNFDLCLQLEQRNH